MHIERVHFDDVFDIVAGRGDFSFVSQGRTYYGVSLQGRLIPQAGSSCLLAFAEPGNWSTVLGWLDPRTGTPVFKEPLWLALLSGFEWFLWFGPALLAGALVFGGLEAALAALVFICGLACLLAYRLLDRRRRTRRALQEAQGREAALAVQPIPDPAGPPGAPR